MLLELWVKIFEDLDCSSILNIKLTYQYFNRLCVNYEFYIKRKFRGFPRLEGYCEYYNIELLSFNCQEISDDITRIIISEYNPIRGDILCLKEFNKYIFDGQKLIKFYRFLPRKFKIINHNVPIYYWRGLRDAILWFDPTEVRQQCIDNITYDKEQQCENGIFCNGVDCIRFHDKGFYTTFVYNNKTYKIIFTGDYSGCDDKELGKRNLVKVFNKYNPLLLETMHYHPERAWPDNILYINEGKYFIINGIKNYKCLIRDQNL